jgi:transposase
LPTRFQRLDYKAFAEREQLRVHPKTQINNQKRRTPMNRNDENKSPYAAFIGLDKSDRKINVSLQRNGESEIERSLIKGSAEALHAWVATLCAQFPHQQVAICLEQPASGLIHALMGYDFIVLFPINPVTLARYREAFTPSRAKDDPTDGDLLCELVARHRQQLAAWQPDDVCTRKLRHLTQARRSSVNMRTRLSNQLKALLKGYFPQALQLCGDDLTTPMACAFLQKWSSLQQLKKARSETVRRFYYAHNARRGDVIEKRLTLIAQAMPLTQDPALIESSIITVQALILGLRAVHTAIGSYDREIARTFSQHPDHALFAALPGSGTVYSARLLAAFGSRRELFQSAEAMLNFSGIAPVLKRSGQACTVHRRYARPLFLHQSFIEYANESIRHSLWARAFYQMHKAAQKTHWVIIRALAYKWIRILFRCWQERTPYDEIRYLKSLQKSSSPLLPFLAQPASLHTVNNFTQNP